MAVFIRKILRGRKLHGTEIPPIPVILNHSGVLPAQTTVTEGKRILTDTGLYCIRIPIFLSNNPISKTVDQYLQAGFNVQVNIDWAGTADAAPFYTDIPNYRSKVTQALEHLAPYVSQIPLVICENEWENPNYHGVYAGMEDDYAALCSNMVEIAQTFGFKTADGALSGNGCSRYTYSKLSGQEAIDWKSHYFVGLNNNYDAFIDSINLFISNLDSIPFDYCNMHWYNKDPVSYGGMPTAASALRSEYTDRSLISNEFGIYYNDFALWQTTVAEMIASGCKFGIAYSGINAPNKAIKLSDSMLKHLADTNFAI